MKGELQTNMVRLVEREGKLEDLDRKVLNEIWSPFFNLVEIFQNNIFVKADQLVTDAAQFEVCSFHFRIEVCLKYPSEKPLIKKPNCAKTHFKLNLLNTFRRWLRFKTYDLKLLILSEDGRQTAKKDVVGEQENPACNRGRGCPAHHHHHHHHCRVKAFVSAAKCFRRNSLSKWDPVHPSTHL